MTLFNFGNSVVSRRLLVNTPISTFGFGYTGFGFPFPIDWFYLKIVKVRDFKLGCTNGVVRFAHNLMCMALAMRKEGSTEKLNQRV